MSQPYSDQAQIQVLQQLLLDRFDQVMSEFEFHMYRNHRMYLGACPIHQGDNTHALSLYHGGDVPGMWQCRTQHCEKTFKRTIVGFIRGLLSQREFGWRQPGDKTVSFQDTLQWCSQFIQKDYRKIEVDPSFLDNRRFVQSINTLEKQAFEGRIAATQRQVRKRLQYPCEYFLRRGWTEGVLNRFDVGTCVNPESRYYQYAIAPIYDEDMLCIGFSARSPYELCGKCGHYHRGKCPTEETRWKYTKWTESPGLSGKPHLYGMWHAREYFKTTGIGILVEGPGEVWRLSEAGIQGGLGLLGNTLSDAQHFQLSKCRLSSIILCLNGDKGGRKGTEDIRDMLSNQFRLFDVGLESGDLGGRSVEEVKGLVVPVIEKAMKYL